MVDVNLKVPVLEKLLDYTASGIGAVAGPMLATWKARKDGEARRLAASAEADARLIEATADAGSLRTIADAQAEARRRLDVSANLDGGTLEIQRDNITQRIEFQERKRQQNIVSVVHRAANELEDTTVANHQPDPDWTARFFGVVQDVSSDDMQKIWARILAGEVQAPGATSLRTLDILKNMTKGDALLFEDVASYMIDGFMYNDADQSEDRVPIDYGVLLHLQDCGLLNSGPFLSVNLNTAMSEHGWKGIYQDFVLIVQPTTKTVQTVAVPCVSLTNAGRELLKITDRHVRNDYLRAFARFLKTQGCRLLHSKIVERLPDGRFKYLKNFDLIDSD